MAFAALEKSEEVWSLSDLLGTWIPWGFAIAFLTLLFIHGFCRFYFELSLSIHIFILLSKLSQDQTICIKIMKVLSTRLNNCLTLFSNKLKI